MIYKMVLDFYGEQAQKGKALEELQELQHAIISNDRQNVVEEIADVMNMLESLKLIYDISDYNIQSEMQRKMNRTIDRIKQNS